VNEEFCGMWDQQDWQLLYVEGGVKKEEDF
jgi:hypothetical protein